MMELTYRALLWPEGWQRTTQRTPSRYRASFDTAHSKLLFTLKMMDARSVVLTANIPLTAAGNVPRTSIYAMPCGRSVGAADVGVAVYFRWQDKDRVFACDCWNGVVDNLRAIGLTLEALRSIERAGATQLLDRVFSGFIALGAPATYQAPWNAVLGVEAGASVEDIKRAYRAKAAQAHPDVGGTNEAMGAVRAAYERGLAERAS